MIELSGVHKTYQMGDIEVRALRGVSLTIEPRSAPDVRRRPVDATS